MTMKRQPKPLLKYDDMADIIVDVSRKPVVPKYRLLSDYLVYTDLRDGARYCIRFPWNMHIYELLFPKDHVSQTLFKRRWL